MKKLGSLVLLVLMACGKRGDPRPPVPVIPQATSDLVVAQRGFKVILSWSYPSLTTTGQSLKGVRRVVVYRASEELPVPPAGRDPKSLPGDVDPAIPRPVALFSRITGLSPLQFVKLRDRIDSIEGANLPAATSGARLVFEDSPAFETRDGRAVRLTYTVVTETESAHSDVSNLASIVPLAVAGAPTGVTVTAKPEGIVLSWTRPATGATPDVPPYVMGFNIYRRAANLPEDAGATPVNAAPVTAATYTDVPAYGEYSYVIRSVSSAGPPRIESAPSEPAKATYKDLLPPSPPTNLVALIETKTIRLVWDPVAAPDLKGYVVYRSEQGNRARLTPQPITASNWIDTKPDPGTAYVYSVTSIDASGNESAPVSTEEMMVPKTP